MSFQDDFEMTGLQNGKEGESVFFSLFLNMTHCCHILPCKLKADKADGEEARPALCYEKTEERKEDKNEEIRE